MPFNTADLIIRDGRWVSPPVDNGRPPVPGIPDHIRNLFQSIDLFADDSPRPLTLYEEIGQRADEMRQRRRHIANALIRLRERIRSGEPTPSGMLFQHYFRYRQVEQEENDLREMRERARDNPRLTRLTRRQQLEEEGQDSSDEENSAAGIGGDDAESGFGGDGYASEADAPQEVVFRFQTRRNMTILRCSVTEVESYLRNRGRQHRHRRAVRTARLLREAERRDREAYELARRIAGSLRESPDLEPAAEIDDDEIRTMYAADDESPEDDPQEEDYEGDENVAPESESEPSQHEQEETLAQPHDQDPRLAIGGPEIREDPQDTAGETWEPEDEQEEGGM